MGWSLGGAGSGVSTESVEVHSPLLSQEYRTSGAWVAKTVALAADRYILQSPINARMDVGGVTVEISAVTSLNLSVAATWDTIDPTDYTVAATRAGLNFYVYACQPASGHEAVLKVSAASTYPDGYDADTSRKIAGFHCLCVAVGTISGHTLTGYLAGDILPQSVWCLKNRPTCTPEGMVNSVSIPSLWTDIYLQSGTGASTVSVYGGTIAIGRIWADHVDDMAAVGKRLLDIGQFQRIASGSNALTAIAGGADPITAGGHSDTAGRRMISNIGVEDACGGLFQWLSDYCYALLSETNHTHQSVATGDPQTITSGNPSAATAPAFANVAGGSSLGNPYSQGADANSRVLGGGTRTTAGNSGPRFIQIGQRSNSTVVSISARGCAVTRVPVS